MNYLLIWEDEQNEGVTYYSLPPEEATAEMFALNKANGKYVNNGNSSPEFSSDYADTIMGFIEPAAGVGHYGFFDGKWFQYKIEAEFLPSTPFAGVFKSGILYDHSF